MQLNLHMSFFFCNFAPYFIVRTYAHVHTIRIYTCDAHANRI